jgi:hypothetical protein
MSYMGSLRVRVEHSPNGAFAVLVDGREVWLAKTRREAEEKALAESSRIEGW